MSRLEDLIRHENAHSGLAFRERGYEKSARSTILRDIVALANAAIDGPRYLVLGARDVVGGERTWAGLSAQTWKTTKEMLPNVLARALEPPIKISLKALDIDGALIGLVCISACDDPPYLLKRDISDNLHAGRGWIRRGTQTLPLDRAELQRMFHRKFGPRSTINLSVGFPGKMPQDEISFAALPLDALPSEVAAQRLKKMIEAKEASKDLLGKTDTHIDRLLHAQQFGSDLCYEQHSDQSLRAQLASLANQYATADDHYRFEQRAHRLEIVVRNDGTSALDNAALLLKIPRHDGIGVAEQLYGPNGRIEDGGRYPLVDMSSRTLNIQIEIGSIPAKATLAAFREPPRFWARETAAGITLPVDYVLYGRQLAEPLADTLRVRIVAGRTT